MDKNSTILNMEMTKGRDLQDKTANMEAAIRSQENDLDIIIGEEEKQRK